MAKASPVLIEALRETADRIDDGARFQWSSFANCNCGNLVQTAIELEPEEIQWAMYPLGGDWASQAEEHELRERCRSTGLPNALIFDQMRRLGLEPRDFRQLERLSNPAVLKRLPRDRLPLRHTRRDDAVLYLRTWADMLEGQVRNRGESGSGGKGPGLDLDVDVDVEASARTS